jgi:hypothetical protein
VDCCEGFSAIRYSLAFSERRFWLLGRDWGGSREGGEGGKGVGR